MARDDDKANNIRYQRLHERCPLSSSFKLGEDVATRLHEHQWLATPMVMIRMMSAWPIVRPIVRTITRPTAMWHPGCEGEQTLAGDACSRTSVEASLVVVLTTPHDLGTSGTRELQMEVDDGARSCQTLFFYPDDIAFAHQACRPPSANKSCQPTLPLSSNFIVFSSQDVTLVYLYA